MARCTSPDAYRTEALHHREEKLREFFATEKGLQFKCLVFLSHDYILFEMAYLESEEGKAFQDLIDQQRLVFENSGEARRFTQGFSQRELDQAQEEFGRIFRVSDAPEYILSQLERYPLARRLFNQTVNNRAVESLLITLFASSEGQNYLKALLNKMIVPEGFQSIRPSLEKLVDSPSN